MSDITCKGEITKIVIYDQARVNDGTVFSLRAKKFNFVLRRKFNLFLVLLHESDWKQVSVKSYHFVLVRFCCFFLRHGQRMAQVSINAIMKRFPSNHICSFWWRYHPEDFEVLNFMTIWLKWATCLVKKLTWRPYLIQFLIILYKSFT